MVAISDGRTSKEFIKRKNIIERFAEVDQELEEDSHDEVAVIDKRGRVHIPEDYLEELGITGKIKMEIQDEKLVIEPYLEN